MFIGIPVNCLSVLTGGMIGTFIKRFVPQKLQTTLPVMFGFCSIGISISSIMRAKNMTVVVISVLLGFIIGQFISIEKQACRFFAFLVQKVHLSPKNMDMDFYITAASIFCCSGVGWYGILTEGFAGDSSILLAKSVMDFFTAVLFASSLGISICIIPFIQFPIFLTVYAVGQLVTPYITQNAFADFCACGGILTLAAGMRVSKIKPVPIADLIPSLILVMPLSAVCSIIFS